LRADDDFGFRGLDAAQAAEKKAEQQQAIKHAHTLGGRASESRRPGVESSWGMDIHLIQNKVDYCATERVLLHMPETIRPPAPAVHTPETKDRPLPE
jgi:hypothetical protein